MEYMTVGTCDKCPLIQILPESKHTDQLLQAFHAYCKGISPSKFMSEMQLNTEQRIEKLVKTYRKNNPNAVHQNVKNIEVIPHQIIFQNFKGSYVYNVILTVINVSKNSCPLRVLFKSSPYFLLRYHTTELPLKLAPGMEMQFNLQFTPEETKDYYHQITFVSCDEKYIIPIVALGPRPLLDLPDQITLPESAVYIGSDKYLLVKNLGEAPAVFKITSKAPFFVNPNSGILDAKGTMQLQVSFKPSKEGSFEDFFAIRFDTGETLVIKLFGTAKNADIYLETNSLKLNDTFMNLKSQKCIKLYNKSKHIVHFEWKHYKSREADALEIEKLKKTQMNFKCGCGDCDCSRIDIDVDPLEDPKHNVNLFCKRIYNDETITKENEALLFCCNCFSIIPLEGDIWPENDTLITVTFTPEEAKMFEMTAYCDVTGRTDRLPLKLTGNGIGPKMDLNLDTMDLKDIYINTVHCFDVCVYNSGSIPGIISFLKCESQFGNILKVKGQSSLFLEPFNHGAFAMQFQCTNEGHFIDLVKYRITQSNQILSFTLVGNALNPSLKFAVTEINFEQVSLGYPATKNVELYNPTDIVMPYTVFMNHDGVDPIVTCAEYFTQKCRIHSDPQEYSLKPTSGYALPSSTTTIEITLTPNIIRIKRLELIVEVFESKHCRTIIPVSHIAVIPEIVSIPAEIHIRFCFINYPANRTMKIKNISALPAQMEFSIDTQDDIQITTDVTKVEFEPYGRIKVSAEILLTQTGVQTATLEALFFGGTKIPLCKITSIGQGPVVSVLPEILNFEEVKLLEWTTKPITILNDSPIFAEISLDVTSHFPVKVSPEQVVINPEETKEFDVSVYLNDLRLYKCTININIKNRNTIYCTVLAKGIGTCIYTEPAFDPFIELGPVLTKQLIIKEFRFINRGVKNHKIIISRQKQIKTWKNFEETTESVFYIEPNIFALQANEEITVTLNGQKRNPEFVTEDFHVHAVIQDIEKKQVIMSTVVTAEFVKPLLKFSKKSIHFRIDFGVEENCAFIKDDIIITNKSKLFLQVQVKIQQPFYILKEKNLLNKLNINLENDESAVIDIYFNTESESHQSLTISGFIEFSYLDHPQVDKIPVQGEVNYPNVRFQPNCVDFAYIPLGCYAHYSVELQNISPLHVSFRWEWEENSYITDLPPVEEPDLTLKTSESAVSIQTSGISESEILFLHLEPEPETEPKSSKKSKRDKSAASSKGKDKASTPKKGAKEEKASKASAKSKKSGKSAKKEPVDEVQLLPTEVIFEHFYVEKYEIFHEILITLLYQEPITVWHLIHDSVRGKYHQLEMKKMIYPALMQYYYSDICEPAMETLPGKPAELDNISKVISLVPHSSALAPYESQIVSFGYRRAKEVRFKVRALCHVLAGPTEYLDVIGICSDIHYVLDRTCIDFHRQVFCEVCQKNIKLSNTGHIPFIFDTSTNGEPEMEYSGHLLESGWLTVQPKNGVLEPGLSVCLMVRYFPGIAGKFLESFQLEIGYLPPVTITVSGYGVFPQVYLSVPRPAICQLPIFLCYEAIASITPDFLEYVQDVKVWCHADIPMYEHDIPKKERKQLKKDGWVIITIQMSFPTVMDIDLAIERMLVCKHILDYPNILINHTALQKTSYIPHFYAPPYEVNFDYVLPDRLVHYTISALNYGPTDAYIRLLQNFKKSGFLEAGFNIQFANKRISPGDNTPIHVMLFAPKEKYTQRRHDLNFTIYLQITHGPRIPINIKAVVTIPYLETSVSSLDFGQVLCGQCKMLNFFVVNSGSMSCNWVAKIEIIRKRPLKYKEKPPKEPCMFYLRKSYGHLEPGEEMLFDIFFEPQKSGVVDWMLILKVENNTELFNVTLKGEGLHPHLNIEEKFLKFDYALPFSTNSFKTFTVENPCSFPIEFYLTDFDNQILLEEKILRILCYYYKTDDLYIPPRLPNKSLPLALSMFYDQLLQQAIAYNFKSQDDSLVSKGHKRQKRGIHKQKSRTKSEKSLELSSKSKINKESLSTISPDKTSSVELSTKIGENAEKLITDYIDMKLDEGVDLLAEFKDPIRAALLESKDLQEHTDSKDGIAVIFHGAPFTNYIYAANKLGLRHDLTVLNIDKLIIDYLVENSTKAVETIMELIDNAYNEVIEKEINTDFSKDANLAPEEKIYMKINTILNDIEAAASGRKSPKKGGKSNRSSSKKSSGKSGSTKEDKNKPDTFVSIPLDLFTDILKSQLLNYPNGFVIDSLNSTFITVPTLALNTLLLAMGNMKYILGILMYNSMDEYEQLQEKKLIEHYDKLEEEKREKLLYFDELSSDELMNLSEEDRQLYKDVYIRERKENTKNRLRMLRILREGGGRRKTLKDRFLESASRKSSRLKMSISARKSKLPKEIKKETSSLKKLDKSKKASPNQKGKKKKRDLSPEDKQINDIFTKFENNFYEILHIFEHWDRENAILKKPYNMKTVSPAKGAKKGGKKSKKKESALSSKRSSAPAITVQLLTMNKMIQEEIYAKIT